MRDDPRQFKGAQTSGSRTQTLVIGLVNNMSSGALKSTEDQFTRLLRAACPQRDISIELFSCCSAGDRGGIRPPYRTIEEMFNERLDAVIVTGMEPQAAHLEEEPAWRCLTRILDWASEAAVPTIWSCLAAHAAVFYLDGIRRSRLPAKLSGVFDCELVDVSHPLALDLPARWSVPHSRLNGLSEAALVEAGYEILSRSEGAGVDSFMRVGPAPFLFFQGHPEYGAGSLLGEYMRDIRRYLDGLREEYPTVPCNYFDRSLEAALDDYRSHALRGHRDPGGIREVLRLIGNLPATDPWHRPAARLYANWIERQILHAPCRRLETREADLPDARHSALALLSEC